MQDFQSELGCRDVVIRAIRALDSRDYDGMAQAFAEDGVWLRGGETLVGPQAVRAALDQRPADLETQHVVANMIIDDASEGAAIVQYNADGVRPAARRALPPARYLQGHRSADEDRARLAFPAAGDRASLHCAKLALLSSGTVPMSEAAEAPRSRVAVPGRGDFRVWCSLQLRNRDTDQFGHVNHAAMATLFRGKPDQPDPGARAYASRRAL